VQHKTELPQPLKFRTVDYVDACSLQHTSVPFAAPFCSKKKPRKQMLLLVKNSRSKPIVSLRYVEGEKTKNIQHVLLSTPPLNNFSSSTAEISVHENNKKSPTQLSIRSLRGATDRATVSYPG
jgi:hypothetical protein